MSPNEATKALSELAETSHLPETRKVASAVLDVLNGHSSWLQTLTTRIRSAEVHVDTDADDMEWLKERVNKLHTDLETLKHSQSVAMDQARDSQKVADAAFEELKRLSETASHPDVRKTNKTLLQLVHILFLQNNQLREWCLELHRSQIDINAETKNHHGFLSESIDQMQSDIARALSVLNLEG